MVPRELCHEGVVYYFYPISPVYSGHWFLEGFSFFNSWPVPEDPLSKTCSGRHTLEDPLSITLTRKLACKDPPSKTCSGRPALRDAGSPARCVSWYTCSPRSSLLIQLLGGSLHRYYCSRAIYTDTRLIAGARGGAEAFTYWAICLVEDNPFGRVSETLKNAVICKRWTIWLYSWIVWRHPCDIREWSCLHSSGNITVCSFLFYVILNSRHCVKHIQYTLPRINKTSNYKKTHVKVYT